MEDEAELKRMTRIKERDSEDDSEESQ